MTTLGWVLVSIFLMVIEFVTYTLVSIWFAIGAIGAGVAAGLGASTGIQLLVFAVVSIIMLIVTFPLVKKFKNKTPERLNADRIIGGKGIITQTVDIVLGTGEAKIGGQFWTCRSVDQSVIKKDSIVEVVRIEGVKAIVKKSN